MATKTAERELVQAETRFWQAMKDQDVETALEMTHDPCIVTGPQGQAKIDHARFAEMMRDPIWELREFRFDDVQVQMLGDDVGIVAYQVHEDLLVDGEPVTLDAADSSTWVRRDGRWTCALHTESLAGDPFGRDRSA